MSDDRKLVKKLAKVMSEIKYIEKRGFNKFNNYKYATESDVAEKVREILSEQSVMMLPDVVEHTTREHTNRKGHIEYIATVKVKFTFIDGETGEELAIHSAGEGQDAGDKAVYKAITGAQKYALMKAFMIPTGDDPEGDPNTDQNNTGEKPNNSQNVSQQANKTTLKSKWQTLNNGSDEGFEEWYNKQKQTYNDNQMNAYLAKKLKERA